MMRMFLCLYLSLWSNPDLAHINASYKIKIKTPCDFLE